MSKQLLRKQLEASLELMKVADRMGIDRHEIQDRSSVEGVIGLSQVIRTCREDLEMTSRDLMRIFSIDLVTCNSLIRDCL